MWFSIRKKVYFKLASTKHVAMNKYQNSANTVSILLHTEQPKYRNCTATSTYRQHQLPNITKGTK